MALQARTLTRGAAAGAIAAGVWAAQMPVDKRVFGSEFDDVKLLGTAITRSRTWPLVGLGVHLFNGALFGAAFAAVRPRLPLPAPLSGALIALGENTALWPLAAITDNLHPAREEMPALLRNGRAFAQETWRHVLFGAVLGAVEQRLNGTPPRSADDFARVVATNGHGKIEHAASMN